jgi:hypothetical protein
VRDDEIITPEQFKSFKGAPTGVIVNIDTPTNRGHSTTSP